MDYLPAFLRKKIVVSDQGCWEWTGYLDYKGYRRSARLRTHIIAYEALHGLRDKTKVFDHLCRNRKCCNPAHLEPVTNRENIMRGEGYAARNARKTHCVNGHSLEDAYQNKKQRTCRQCAAASREKLRDWNREYQAQWRAKNRDKCREAQARHRAKQRLEKD